MQAVGRDREKITEEESCALSLRVTTSLPVLLTAEFVHHVSYREGGLSTVLRTRFRPGPNQRISWPAEPESLGPAIAETNSRMSPWGCPRLHRFSLCRRISWGESPVFVLVQRDA